MTKSSSSGASSLGPGIPTRRRSNSASASSGDKAGGSNNNNNNNNANGNSASATTTRSNSLAANRPKRRSRGLPLTRANASPKKQDEDAEESDSHHSASTSASHEITMEDSHKSSKKTSTPKSSRSTAALQTPSPKSSNSNNNSALTISGALTASNKQGKSFKVTLLVGGEVFSPIAAPSLTQSPLSASTRKRTRTAAAAAAASISNTSTTANTDGDDALEEAMTTPPTTPSSSANKTATSKSVATTTTTDAQLKATDDIAAAPAPLGHDGNVYRCYVCSDFGDVICCDGCPNVCHRNCISKEHPSRISLDNDEDPWYCPSCHDNKKITTAKRPLRSGKTANSHLNNNNNNSSSSSSKKKGGSSNNRNSKAKQSSGDNNNNAKQSPSRACIECGRAGGSLEQCQICQEWMHYPSCAVGANATQNNNNNNHKDRVTPKKEGGAGGGAAILTILCSKCREDGGDPPLDNNNNSAVSAMDVSGNITAATPEKHGSSDSHNKAMPSSKKKKKRKRAPAAAVDAEPKQETPPPAPVLDSTPTTTSTRRRTRSVANTEEEEASVPEDGVEDTSSSASAAVDKPSALAAGAKSPKREDEEEKEMQVDEPNGDAKEGDDGVTNDVAEPVKKRLRPGLPQSGPSPVASPSAVPAGEKKGKKTAKKKKKKKKVQPEEETPMEEDAMDDGAMRPFYGSGSSMLMAKATPAFYFFLAENRLKIERNLSRKHRYFNRLPKGYDRNEIVAKEGANLWVKLRPSEIRRYMTMSMRDFEQRTVEWKEEKNIREMLTETDIDGEDGDIELSAEDEAWTHQNHERLYLGTTVGSKPFKPEPDESHNRVLLELLQDMRFHPVPMFIANRTETEYGQMDFARITIPYFDVHGPVSTSVGDECLGCTRGWTHYCNVLKRRIPAVEHRAKLQPPLSSLVATRVGLGMRPRPQEVVDEKEKGKGKKSNKDAPVFAQREVEAAKDAKNLPWVPWDSMKNPSERADDIVQFVEEAVSMKVPEPPRPGMANIQPEKEVAKKTMLPKAILPTSKGRKRPSIDSLDSGFDADSLVNKCGRCRTVIQTDTGCIQCRRAQLVINMSKRGPKDEGGGKSSSKSVDGKGRILKCQTYMLGRINMKEGSGEVQSDGDQAIANGILRQRWTPFVVLPPHTLDAPTPQPKRTREEPDDETADDELPKVTIPEVPKAPAVPEKPIQPVLDDGRIESGDGSDDNTRTSSKRIRSARIGAQVTQPDPLDDSDRQLLAQRYKEEADELHRKCLSVACCGILLALMRRDPLLLFAAPVTAEGYTVIIKNPIDFEKIRSSVLAGKYVTLGSFVSDARLLCTNALAYNPPGSIYWKTAKELYDVLAVMQKRASNWMGAVKDAHAFAWRRAPKTRISSGTSDDGHIQQNGVDEFFIEDPFEGLRKKWPEAVEMLENSDWLRQCIQADFMRTKENETAYYGSLACRRAAVAAEASLAPYPDTSGVFTPVGKRNHVEDEHLRRLIDERVSEVIDPVELKDLPTWREESIVRVMRRAQSRRLEGLIGSVNGCARCDGMRVDQELKMAMTAEAVRWGRTRRKKHEVSRVHTSRVALSTGLASQNTMKRINKTDEPQPNGGSSKSSATTRRSAEAAKKNASLEIGDAPPDVAVSVRGSRVHGWGLFADQPFTAGDVVAEYIGEYVSLAVTEAREKAYQEQRIQDYQFRLDDQLVIDATMHGGHGRYINHNCSPNCIAKIIPGPAPNEHLKRVIIIAQRDIDPREELTYDYQFPLELDLDARIPCNCHSEHCRGFMNWDLPEKGANNRVFRSQKRGANMRDRIRRLGRPLKSDKEG